MTLSRLSIGQVSLRRTIGVSIVFVLYSVLVPLSEANEAVYLEYLVFTHQNADKLSHERDTWHNHLLASSAFSRKDTLAQSSHALISGSGLLQQHNRRLKESPFYRVILHARAGLTKSSQIAPVRFRIRRAGSQESSELQINFQYGGSSNRWLTTNALYAPFPKVGVKSDGPLPQRSAGTRSPPWILRDSRRLGVGEIHYLDHPAFGILLVLAEEN